MPTINSEIKSRKTAIYQIVSFKKKNIKEIKITIIQRKNSECYRFVEIMCLDVHFVATYYHLNNQNQNHVISLSNNELVNTRDMYVISYLSQYVFGIN